jgi:hypothetical protein
VLIANGSTERSSSTLCRLQHARNSRNIHYYYTYMLYRL